MSAAAAKAKLRRSRAFGEGNQPASENGLQPASEAGSEAEYCFSDFWDVRTRADETGFVQIEPVQRTNRWNRRGR